MILTALANGGLAIARSAVYNIYMATRAMQEATFMILTALADGAQHGYGILTDVRDISGGQVRLRAGTLYMALDRLRADELIAVDREEVVDGRLRRYYRLTPAGTKVLADEAARLQAHAAVALKRLNLAGGWRHDRSGPPGTGLPAAAGLVSPGLPAGERAGDPRGTDGRCPRG